jgi:transposase
MDVLVRRCAGLDVHRDTVVATVRVPGSGPRRRVQHTRTFATTTAGITRLGDWLAEHRVTRAGMESTGVYWKPVYYLLEDQLEVWLINAEHLHNVPGRKTDLLTELPDRSFERCARRSAVLARFRPRDQRRGRAAGVLRVGGAAARLA